MIQVIEVPQAPLPPDVTVIGMPGQVPIILLVIAVIAVVAAAFVLAPLVRAFARRIEGGGDRALRAELEETRQRLDAMEQQALTSGEVDASYQRLYDVEERLEFVERVLSSGREKESE